MELDKFFDFLKDEKNLYSQWEQSNCFKPQKGGDPYSIMMPPHLMLQEAYIWVML